MLTRLILCCVLAASAERALAQAEPLPPTQHPALFLVGDSIVHTGTGDGSTGPWGWGAEIIPMFDAAKMSFTGVDRRSPSIP